MPQLGLLDRAAGVSGVDGAARPAYRAASLVAFTRDRQRHQFWHARRIQGQGWKDIGTSYYRMGPGTILPTHKDLYLKYIEIFNLQGKEHTIRRAVVFLEDWQSGHYFEYLDNPYTNWKAGAVVEWEYDAPHMAANLGSAQRYTLQITGHVDD